MKNFKAFQIAEAMSDKEIGVRMDTAVFEKMAELMSKDVGTKMTPEEVEKVVMTSPKLRKVYQAMQKQMVSSFKAKKKAADAKKVTKESVELFEAAPKAKQKVSDFVSGFTKELSKTVTKVKQAQGNANTMIDLSVQKVLDKHAKAIVSALTSLGNGF